MAQLALDKSNDWWVEYFGKIDTSTTRTITRSLRQDALYESFIRDMKLIHGDLSVPELMYIMVSGTAKPCSRGNTRKFSGYTVGYISCTSGTKCACVREEMGQLISQNKLAYDPAKKAAIRAKREQTVAQRYGVTNVFESNEVKEKSKQTLIQRYGVENPQQHKGIREKTSQTNQQRHGVDNPAQAEIIKDKIKETNLNRYGTSCVLSSETIRNKIVNTNLERYGVDNPLKNEQIKNRMQMTCLDRYGVTNPSKHIEVIDKIKETQRISSYNRVINRTNPTLDARFELDQFGSAADHYDWTCKTCGYEFQAYSGNGLIPKCKRCAPSSKPQAEIQDFIESLGFTITINDRSQIGPKEIDIYIPSMAFGIEYCGLYWHGEKSGNKNRSYHLEKLELASNAGIRLITVFGDEWAHKRNIVESRIRSQLRVDPPEAPLYARKLQLQRMDPTVSNEFVQKYHIQGACNARYHYGLYLGDIPISVMTFSKARFGNNHYELIRYCTSKVVIGGAQRLLTEFIRQVNPDEIISYADRRWSIGSLYEQLGFKRSGISKPGYWYFNQNQNNVRMHRLNFTKQKLLKENHDSNLTEWEIMQSLGYDRIWDCGQLVYKWNK